MKLTKQDVLAFLPHRDPFLFVDTIEEININSSKSQNNLEAKDLVDSTVHATFLIKEDMEVLKGHFPGNPIVPGVVQIEMMAQASAFISYPLCLGSTENIKVETLLLGVEKTKFRKVLTPPNQVNIKARMTKYRAGMATYEASIESNGNLIAQADFLAKITITKES